MTAIYEDTAIDFDDTDDRSWIAVLLLVVTLMIGLFVGSVVWVVRQERSDAQIYMLAVAEDDYGIQDLHLKEQPGTDGDGWAWYYVPGFGQNCASPFSYFEEGQPTFLAHLLHSDQRIMIHLEFEACIPVTLPTSTY